MSHTPDVATVRNAYAVYQQNMTPWLGHPARLAAEDQFDRWFAKEILDAKADAWDAGLMAERAAYAASQVHGVEIAPEPNPYRERWTL